MMDTNSSPSGSALVYGASTPVPCRFCSTRLSHRVVDLGMSPLCESYLTGEQLDHMEPFYPLHVWVCDVLPRPAQRIRRLRGDLHRVRLLLLVLVESWLEHAEEYVATITDRFGLDDHSFVVELASNDGYLLQLVRRAGHPCLGIEPAANVAAAAAERACRPTSRSSAKTRAGSSPPRDGRPTS